MAVNDWYEAGDRIKQMVQDAVDSGDFSRLGSTISEVVGDTVYGFQDALRRDLGGRQQPGGQYGRTDETGYYGTSEASGYGGQAQAGARVPGEMGCQIQKFFGFGMSLFFLIVAVMLWLMFGSRFFPWHAAGFRMLSAVMLILFVCSFALGMSGQMRLGRTRRFYRYQEVLGARTYCPIEELASGVGADSRYVVRDLKKMVRRGYFPEGYLDRQETVFITDQATYQQYLQAEEDYEQRRRDEENAKEQEEAAEKEAEDLSPEHRKLIEEGQRYIRHIHECNDRIPGEEMTAKLSRLELVVTRIFQTAEKHPSKVSELRKMMSYYLPTTQKLLDAYCDLDAQPVGGKNIDTTKREIESALDTINTAFENLLDSLYEEQAWDISSDISVLNSMLAQEGLTHRAFDKNQTGGE